MSSQDLKPAEEYIPSENFIAPRHPASIQGLGSPPTLNSQSHLYSLASPQTRQRSSPGSRTESMQASGQDYTERSPLLPAGSPKETFLRDENVANNLSSKKGSPTLKKSTPPKQKLQDPVLNVTRSTTPGTDDLDILHSRKSTVLINDDGPAAEGEKVKAPPRNAKMKVTCGCVARMACCFTSVLIVLGGLVFIGLWPTVISAPNHLLHNHTVPTGLLFIEPSNPLAKGGAKVTLNLTNMTDPSKLQTHYYYGPMPSEDLYTSPFSAHFVFNKAFIENSRCYRFAPFVFEASRQGIFAFEIKKKASSMTNDVIVALSVFASYEEAVSESCSYNDDCTFDDNNNDTFVYYYDNKFDSCGRSDSYYGHRRYFRITVKSGDETELAEVTFQAQLKFDAYGALNVSALNSLKTCSALDKDTKTVTCDIPYNSFFSEVGASNYLLIVTDTTDLPDLKGSDNFATILTVNSEEGFRGDLLGMVAGVVLVAGLAGLLVFMYQRLWGCFRKMVNRDR